MELSEGSRAFSALSDQTRLETIIRLVDAGPRGLSAGTLSAAQGVPPPTMSFHLKELARNGLVHARKEGRSVLYAANYGGLRDLVDFLMRDCLKGDPRLCGPYVVSRTP